MCVVHKTLLAHTQDTKLYTIVKERAWDKFPKCSNVQRRGLCPPCSVAPILIYSLHVPGRRSCGRVIPEASRFLSAARRTTFTPLDRRGVSRYALRCCFCKCTQTFQNLKKCDDVCWPHRRHFLHHIDVRIVSFRCVPNTGDDDEGIHRFIGSASTECIVSHVFHGAI